MTTACKDGHESNPVDLGRKKFVPYTMQKTTSINKKRKPQTHGHHGYCIAELFKESEYLIYHRIGNQRNNVILFYSYHC